MELVYLFIKNYRSLKEVEFNFCPDIWLSYDAEICCVREIPIPNKLPTGFWGDNIRNFSMIVGNNGAGKTSVMQYMIDTFAFIHEGRYISSDGILVVKDEDHLYYMVLGRMQVKIMLENRTYTVTGCDRLQMHKVLCETKVIYYTNTLAQQDYLRNRKMFYSKDKFFYDCSVGGSICNDNKYDIKQKHQGDWAQLDDMEVQLFFIYEQYKQVKFVFDRKQYHNLQELRKRGFQVPLPEKLKISLSTDLDILYDREMHNEGGREYLAKKLFPSKYEQIEEIRKRYSQIVADEVSIRKRKDLEELILKYHMICCAFEATICSMQRVLSDIDATMFISHISNSNNNYLGEKNEYMETMEKLWGIFKSIITKTESAKNRRLEKLFSCENYYYEFIDFINSETLTNHFSIEGSLFDLFRNVLQQNGGISFTVSVNDADWFMNFMQKYRYICNPDYFLDFSWNMSSGENNLLNMFSSLYYVYESDFTNEKNGQYSLRNVFPEKDNECNSILLMMDEADLSYHPEWQRQYINILVAFLEKLYPSDCFGSIQVILSTHSPILLGDMPKQNVFFLEKDSESGNTKLCAVDQLNTFGQNIHLLFRKGFFLENGTIGDFAYGKIKYVMTELKALENIMKEQSYFDNNEQFITRNKNKLSELQTYIDIIAEPIIRKKLMIEIERVRKRLHGESSEPLVGNLTNEELEKRWEILNKERERRKNDTNTDLQRAYKREENT